MARITVEDCLVQENNRFALVQLASKRTKQILRGAQVKIDETKNKAVVTALREIAAGEVRFMTPEEVEQFHAEEEAKRQRAMTQPPENPLDILMAAPSSELALPADSPAESDDDEADDADDEDEEVEAAGDDDEEGDEGDDEVDAESNGAGKPPSSDDPSTV